jgi:hypothetical protein
MVLYTRMSVGVFCTVNLFLKIPALAVVDEKNSPLSPYFIRITHTHMCKYKYISAYTYAHKGPILIF